MFEWRLLTKEEKDKIISEYMKQDEEMDFMEYARRKRDMIFMCEDIEYWERFSKRLKELRISDKKEQEEERKVRKKNIEEIKKRRKMFEKIRQEREMLKYMTEKNRKEVERVQQIAEEMEKNKEWQKQMRITKTGYETNKEGNRVGEFKSAEAERKKQNEEWQKQAWGVGSNAGNETYLFTGKELKKVEPIKYNSSGIQDNNGEYEYKNGVLEPVIEKSKPKRVKLSEMSDAELKEHYKKLEEEKERRKRIQADIVHEKRINELKEFREKIENMSYWEIINRYTYIYKPIANLPGWRVLNTNIEIDKDYEKQRIVEEIWRKKYTPEIQEQIREANKVSFPEAMLTIILAIIIFIAVFVGIT